jgi:hypothetical protein
MMSEFLGAAKMNRLTDGMSIDFRLSLAARRTHSLLAVNVPVMSLSFLASDRKMSGRQSKKEKVIRLQKSLGR